jgi:hypothetical protein
MNPPKKLTSRQQIEQQQESKTEQQTQTGAGIEFATVDDMLRHDALHTPVPPNIAKRLSESLAKEAPIAKPWWKRLFGGSGNP